MNHEYLFEVIQSYTRTSEKQYFIFFDDQKMLCSFKKFSHEITFSVFFFQTAQTNG